MGIFHHFIIGSLLRWSILLLDSECDCPELISVGLRLAKTLRNAFGVSVSGFFHLVSFFVKKGLVGLGEFDLKNVLLHLDHHAFDSFAGLCVEN